MSGRSFDDTQKLTTEEFESLRGQLFSYLKELGCTEISPVGSTGKAPVMGDIDLAVEHPEGRNGLHLLIKKAYPDAKKFGSGLITLRYPLPDKFVQLDIMVGRVEWLTWARHAPTPSESKIKGVYRNLLLNAILRERATYHKTDAGEFRFRLTIDWDTGLNRVAQTITGENGERLKHWKALDRMFLSDIPERVVSMTFNGGLELPLTLPLTFDDVFACQTKVDRDQAVKLAKSFPDELANLKADDETVQEIKLVFDRILAP